MSEEQSKESEAQAQASPTQSTSPVSASPPKIEPDMKKEKRKKQKALMEFLSKPDNDIIDLPRREDDPVDISEATNCKICGQLSQKRRQCEFCKDVVCFEHLRKKRKHKVNNKFTRICDDCEDKQLHDKYVNLESKAEEAQLMQEMIIQGKHQDLADLVSSKQAKIAVLRAKRAEIEEQQRINQHRLKVDDHEITNKEKKFEIKAVEQKAIEEGLIKLQESLPRPLDDDFNCLLDQNNKINKELLKYQKLVSEALKAKSVREKELIQAYQKWEKKETVKAHTKKKDDCSIY